MGNGAELYKIRQVVDLTGVSEYLLRVWEDRYMAFTPSRTRTGRRLYGEGDILKARALLELTQRGARVGEIAHLHFSQLNRMLQQTAVAEAQKADPSTLLRKTDSRVKKIVSCVNRFDWQEVRSLVFEDKVSRKNGHDPLDWIHAVIVPLVIEMGRQVDAGGFTVAEEHILSAMIKEGLAFRSNKVAPLRRGPRIVFAAPEGDYHDLGILIAAFIANQYRVNTLFLGAHMPKSELAAVCIRFRASHLLLSSTATREDGTKDDYLKYLNFLDRNLDSKITLWLAGRNSQKYSAQLERPHKQFDSFESFEIEVKKCL